MVYIYILNVCHFHISELFLRNVFIQLENEDIHVFMHSSLQDVLVRLTELSNVEQTIKLLQILKDNTTELFNDGKSRKVMCSLLLQVAEFSSHLKNDEQDNSTEALRDVFLEICQTLKGDVENILVVKTVLQVLSGHVNMPAKDLGMYNFNWFCNLMQIKCLISDYMSIKLFIRYVQFLKYFSGIKRAKTSWSYTPPTEFVQTFHEMCEEIFSLDDFQGKNLAYPTITATLEHFNCFLFSQKMS